MGHLSKQSPLLENAVANIICSLLFGKRYEYGNKEFIELQHCIDKIFEFIGTCSMVNHLILSLLHVYTSRVCGYVMFSVYSGYNFRTDFT